MYPDVAADLAKLFGRARRDAAAGGCAGLAEHEVARALPTVCSYSLDQIVSHDWYPRNQHGIVDALVDDASA